MSAFTVRLASRKSPLARLQTHQVGNSLRSILPALDIQLLFKEASADQDLVSPLWKWESKGAFTQDFVEDLLGKKADLVVHSYKDLPTEVRPFLQTHSILEREDPRDLLVLKPTARNKSELRIFSSSPRRGRQLKDHLAKYVPFPISKIELRAVRGNIRTRLQKMMDDAEIDGIVVAKAAVDRFLKSDIPEFADEQKFCRDFLDQNLWMLLPISDFPCAPAQGALAVEYHQDLAIDKPELFNAIQKLRDEATERACVWERKELQKIGGGCHQEVGFFSKWNVESPVFIGSKNLENKPMPDFNKDRWVRSDTFLAATRTVNPNGEGAQGETHFIARWEDSLVDAKSVDQLRGAKLIGCAGLKTWKKLAKLGIWVNFSTEGLGWSWSPSLRGLNLERSGCLWTHSDSNRFTQGRPEGFEKTYEYYSLNFTFKNLETLFNTEYFHWKSASAFDYVIRQYPRVLSANHRVGPGTTADYVRRYVAPERLWISADSES